MCKQYRVHKNRKAGASQPSSKLAAWKLLGRTIFFKISLNMMKGGYFSRITLVVFQIEKYSEADSVPTLCPASVSKQISELNQNIPPSQKNNLVVLCGAGLNNRFLKLQ